MKILICRDGGEDERMWKLIRDDLFLVKSAYFYISWSMLLIFPNSISLGIGMRYEAKSVKQDLCICDGER